MDLERENAVLRSQMQARENLHYQVIGGLKSGLEKEVAESKKITTHVINLILFPYFRENFEYRQKQDETNQQFNNLREQITYVNQNL